MTRHPQPCVCATCAPDALWARLDPPEPAPHCSELELADACCDRFYTRCNGHCCWCDLPPPVAIAAPEVEPANVLRTVAWIALAAFAAAFALGLLVN